ncbi:Uma2 family endonuclease [Ornithinimicrobium murale]|uniref:Uma2 family endonuclease n=1 Tax=Ornithinimicrobium murale TaxID=1050153 RepID=UPI000E0DD761|nr:Uma2 family endonuclease [Ornithinimicrobium murale]
MSSMPTLTDHAEEHRVSRAEFEALREARRDGSRFELLAGEVLVTPSPSFLHQYASGELFSLLKARLSGDLVLLSAPFDVHFDAVDGAEAVLQPDLLIAPRTNFTDSELPVAPTLAVEILSPSTWRRDLGSKRDAYAAAGVQHYWVVAPSTPSITVYARGEDAAYREEAHLTDDQSWTVRAPVEVTLRPADLVR